jgi:hypothetical protein
MSTLNERIVCAAIQHEANKDDIILGIKHFDDFMLRLVTDNLNNYIDGFVTNKLKFVNRVEAYNIAVKSKQITKSENKLLISEQLYHPEDKRRLVCAANMYDNGKIILGVRHFDGFMYKTINWNRKSADEKTKYEIGRHRQGFIDQFGNFYHRDDALKLAIARNQIIRDKDKLNKELFSENLY